jgi:hypothetical protein
MSNFPIEFSTGIPLVLHCFQDRNSPVGQGCVYQWRVAAVWRAATKATPSGDVGLQSHWDKFIHVEFYVHG